MPSTVAGSVLRIVGGVLMFYLMMGAAVGAAFAVYKLCQLLLWMGGWAIAVGLALAVCGLCWAIKDVDY